MLYNVFEMGDASSRGRNPNTMSITSLFSVIFVLNNDKKMWFQFSLLFDINARKSDVGAKRKVDKRHNDGMCGYR